MTSGLKAFTGLFATAAAAAAISTFAAGASAQVVGIGTTKGGATAQVANAIAKIVTTKGGLQMRAQAMGGTQQYIPIVNAGELDFGVANLPQYWMAKTGTGISEGTKYDNLRLAATLMTFKVGVLVAEKSGIKKVSDLKGKNVGFGFKAAPLFQFVMTAFLANPGLTFDDVKKVPAVGLPQHWDLFKQGRIDVVIAAVGTGAVKEMDAVIDGGVRYVSLDTSDEAIKRTVAIYPKSYLAPVSPGPGLAGVKEPTQVLNYDYMIFTHKGASDEAVYKTVKVIHDNEKEIKETSPVWNSHFSKRMGKDQRTDYHPGAMKFYKEAGIAK